MIQIEGIHFSQKEPEATYEFRPDNPESIIISSLEQIQSSYLSGRITDQTINSQYLPQEVSYSVWNIRKSLENDYETELIIRSNNGFQILSSLLQATNNLTVIDHTIHSLRILSQNFSSDLSEILDFGRIIELVNGDTDLITKKNALSLICNISSRRPTASIINEIIKLHDFNDPTIRINMIIIITNIFETMSQEIQPDPSIQIVIDQLFSIPPKIRDKCLSSLTKIAVNIENATKIIKSNIDFNKLLHIQNQTQENQKYVLSLILTLLPRSKKLEPLGHPKNDRPNISIEFAKQIQPILSAFIVERPICPHLSLLAFSASLICNSIEFDVSYLLISSLLSYSTNENLAPYVLAAFSFIFDINKQNEKKKKNEIEMNSNEFQNLKSIKIPSKIHSLSFQTSENLEFTNHENDEIEQSNYSEQFFENEKEKEYLFENSKIKMKNYPEIVQVLTKAKVNPQIKKWYNEGIRVLNSLMDDESINFEKLNLKEITEMIENKKISPIEFIYGQGADRALQLLKEEIEKNNLSDLQPNPSDISERELKILSEFATENLSIFPLSCNYGSNSIIDFLNVLQSNGTLQVVLPSQKTIQINAPLHSPISLVEGLINSEMAEFNSDTMKNLIEETPEIKRMLNLSYPLQASQLSVLYRAIDSSYPALKFLTGDKNYTVHDSWFSIFCDNEKKKNPLICEDDDRNSKEEKTIVPKLKELKLYFFTSLFEILSILSLKFGYETKCQKFIEKVRYSLSYPFNSIGRLSPNLKLIFTFPFLFPTDLRTLAFKLIAFDPLSSLKELVQEFGNYKDDFSLLPKQSPLKIVVSKDRIFEDGIKYLKLFAQNKIPVEVQFEGEPATGPGPTQEFFYILSDEFKKRKIFRFDESQGLFPSPDADPKIFEYLGILVAKSLSMNCTTNLQFNPAFFEKLRGNKITLEQIDPLMNINLDKNLIGIEFEYPGHPKINLLGDENIENYSDEEFRFILNKVKLMSNIKKEVHREEENENDKIIEQLDYYKEKTKDFDQLFDMCQMQMQLFEQNRNKIQRKKKSPDKLFNFKFPESNSQTHSNYEFNDKNDCEWEKLKNLQNSQLKYFDGVFVTMNLNNQQKKKISMLKNSVRKSHQRQLQLQKTFCSKNIKKSGQFLTNQNQNSSIEQNKILLNEINEKPFIENSQNLKFNADPRFNLIKNNPQRQFNLQPLQKFAYQEDNPDQQQFIKKNPPQQFAYQEDNPDQQQFIKKNPPQQFAYQEDNPDQQQFIQQQQNSQQLDYNENNPQQQIKLQIPQKFSYQEDNPDDRQQQNSQQFAYNEDNPNQQQFIQQHQQQISQQFAYQEDNPDQQQLIRQHQQISQQFAYNEENPDQQQFIHQQQQISQQFAYQENNPDQQQLIQQPLPQQFAYNENNPGQQQFIQQQISQQFAYNEDNPDHQQLIQQQQQQQNSQQFAYNENNPGQQQFIHQQQNSQQFVHDEVNSQQQQPGLQTPQQFSYQEDDSQNQKQQNSQQFAYNEDNPDQQQFIHQQHQQQISQQFAYNEDNPDHQQLIQQQQQISQQFAYNENNPGQQQFIHQQQNSQQFVHDEDNSQQQQPGLQTPQQFSYQEDDSQNQKQQNSQQFAYDENKSDQQRFIQHQQDAQQLDYDENNPQQQEHELQITQQFSYRKQNYSNDKDVQQIQRQFLSQGDIQQQTQQYHYQDEELNQQQRQFNQEDEELKQQQNQPFYEEENQQQQFNQEDEELKQQQNQSFYEEENQQQQFNQKDEELKQQQNQSFYEEENHHQQFNQEDEELKQQQNQPFYDEENQQQQQFNQEDEEFEQQQNQSFYEEENHHQQFNQEDEKLKQQQNQPFYDEDNQQQQQFNQEDEEFEQQQNQSFYEEENQQQQQFYEDLELNQPQSQFSTEPEENDFYDYNDSQKGQIQIHQDPTFSSEFTEDLENEKENTTVTTPSLLINSDNEAEFRRLVREKSVGTNIERCCKYFKRGFNSVIPFEFTNLFTSEELSYLIGGEPDLITYEDLISNVELDGFTLDDPQIIDFFNIIVELDQVDQQRFLRFVTAARNLPLGGLKSLSPHIKITRVDYKEINIDSAYPTVSTCTHLLKLPPFSSKENLKRNLMIALEKNCQSFQLG